MEEVSLFFIVSEGVRMFRKASPFKEGHLRNSVKETQTGRREHTISIGGEEAPYAVYTNEVWVAPRWNGKKNPNEHWIDNAVEDFVDYICEKTGGKLVKFSGIEDRWSNKSYWESEEGKQRLERYKIDDYKSAVSRVVTV
jgi:hypothetical protein